jgi:predicted transcriptional regulator of viral defense system
MHDLLALLAVAAQPFTIAEAAICGVERHAVARLTRGGALHRVDRGAYVLDTVWRDATAEQRHLSRCRPCCAATGRWR